MGVCACVCVGGGGDTFNWILKLQQITQTERVNLYDIVNNGFYSHNNSPCSPYIGVQEQL